MIAPARGLERAATSSLAMFAGPKRLGVDEQELLFDPEREVGLQAEAVLHAVSLRPQRPIVSNPMSAKDTLIAELRRHALVVGEVTLTSGATAQYYVDAKRAILRPAGFAALGRARRRLRPPMGGDGRGRPDDGRRRPGLRRARGRRGREGLLRAQGDQGPRPAAQGRGPAAGAGRALPDRRGRRDHAAARPSRRSRRCAPRATTWSASSSILDRLAGGAAKIALASGDAPYEALATIDDVYPDRPDRRVNTLPGAPS